MVEIVAWLGLVCSQPVAEANCAAPISIVLPSEIECREWAQEKANRACVRVVVDEKKSGNFVLR